MSTLYNTLDNKVIRLRSSLNDKRKKVNRDKWRKSPFFKLLGIWPERRSALL